MKIDYQVIKQYLDGKGTSEDRSRIISWFRQSDTEEELKEKSGQYWNDVPGDAADEEYDESVLLGRIYREIRMKEYLERSKPRTLIRIINFVAKIAAILFIPLLILYVSKDGNQKYTKSEITYTEIYSPLGARTMFYLPDGSKGWLSGGSYLKYSEGFPGKTRDVSLKGQAYFDVISDKKKPFVVYGKSLEIIAKGTSFNVLAWEDEPETEIVLVDGKLDIYHKSDEGRTRIASLDPGELLHHSPEPAETFVNKADVEKYTSWTKGKLIFREDPITDVVKSINRWYNVNIVIMDGILESYRYVATFQDETLDELLKMLSISSPIRYRDLPRKQLDDGTFEKRTIELYYDTGKKKN